MYNMQAQVFQQNVVNPSDASCSTANPLPQTPPETTMIVVWMDHRDSMWREIVDQFEKGRLTDVTLVCELRCIHAHKMILSAGSLYFKELFQNITIGHHTVIQISNISYDNLMLIINFLYKGKLNIPSTKFHSLHEAACILRVENIMKLSMKEYDTDRCRKRKYSSTMNKANKDSVGPPLPRAARPAAVVVPRPHCSKGVHVVVEGNGEGINTQKTKTEGPPSAVKKLSNEWKAILTQEQQDENEISEQLKNMLKSAPRDIRNHVHSVSTYPKYNLVYKEEPLLEEQEEEEETEEEEDPKIKKPFH